MIATFAHSLQMCLETGLFQAITSLWPDYDSAKECWQATAVPLIQEMGLTPLAVSLLPSRSRQKPTQALLASLTRDLDNELDIDVEGMRFDRALERLLSRRWAKAERVVLFVNGVDRWCGARWRNDVSAFRAVAQANQSRLFVVYVCIDRAKKRSLFGDVREPLYREGLPMAANADGWLLN